ncbi:MAG TPA: TonB-dependent receptor plug domain-containing protein [Caulobacteraceae bacterium]|nr:TonB-dependent receptor plug domain-containing protein [Caulobacteraceae bacterium]
MAFAALQAAPPAALAPAVPTAGVAVYSADFFASAAPTTAYDVIRLIPGFVFDPGQQVRGFVGTASNVLIDGVRPASKEDTLDDILRRTPASDIVRVEVVRGGAPGIDMQGKTVIANLILRRHRAPKATLTAQATRDAQDRYHGLAHVLVDWGVGPVSFEANGQIARYFDDGAGRGFKVRTNASGERILYGRESEFGIANDDRGEISAEFRAGPGALRLAAGYASAPQPYHLATSDVLTTPQGWDGEDLHLGGQTGEFSGRYEAALSSRLALEAVAIQQVGRSLTTDYFFEPPNVAAMTGDDSSDLFTERQRRSESIGSVKLRWQVDPHLSLNTGAEFDYNWLGTTTSFIENGVPQAVPAADVHVTEARGEGYALAVWAPDRRLNIEAGLRLEASRLASSGDVTSTQTFIFPKPRLALSYNLDPADQARVRIEREVTQLDFNDFAANQGYISQGDVRAGNPRLVPQSDWVVEGAFERRFLGAADASVTGRHYAISNVIDRAPVRSAAGDFDEPANIGSGTRDELAVGLTIPLDRLHIPRAQINGQTTFRWSHVVDPTTGQGRTISGVHSNDWEAHFTQGFPRLRATWGVDVIGPANELWYRFDEIDSFKRGTYAVAWAEWKPTRDLACRIDIKNLSNRDTQQGRQVWTDFRLASPLYFNELRELRSGRFITLRVIKTLG